MKLKKILIRKSGVSELFTRYFRFYVENRMETCLASRFVPKSLKNEDIVVSA
jgi:hypothetical protein